LIHNKEHTDELKLFSERLQNLKQCASVKKIEESMELYNNGNEKLAAAIELLEKQQE